MPWLGDNVASSLVNPSAAIERAYVEGDWSLSALTGETLVPVNSVVGTETFRALLGNAELWAREGDVRLLTWAATCDERVRHVVADAWMMQFAGPGTSLVALSEKVAEPYLARVLDLASEQSRTACGPRLESAQVLADLVAKGERGGREKLATWLVKKCPDLLDGAALITIGKARVLLLQLRDLFLVEVLSVGNSVFAYKGPGLGIREVTGVLEAKTSVAQLKSEMGLYQEGDCILEFEFKLSHLGDWRNRLLHRIEGAVGPQ